MFVSIGRRACETADAFVKIVINRVTDLRCRRMQVVSNRLRLCGCK